MKRVILAMALGILIGNASIAAADITISDTSPKAGAALTVGPNVVSITASVPLLDQGNLIVVNDPNGVAVDDGSITVNGSTAIVGMKPLTTTGVYTVNYTLVADALPDLTGSYTFMYTSPGAVSSPTAQPTSSSAGSINNASNAASNAFVYLLLFLAALVAIFLVWYARVIFGGKPKRRTPVLAQPTPTAPRKRVPAKKAIKKKL